MVRQGWMGKDLAHAKTGETSNIDRIIVLLCDASWYSGKHLGRWELCDDPAMDLFCSQWYYSHFPVFPRPEVLSFFACSLWQALYICLSLVPIFFFFLRTTPVAYGSSKARGPIGAAATWDLSCVCDLHHKLMARLDPWPTEWGQGSSWILVGLVSTEPQWELPFVPILCIPWVTSHFPGLDEMSCRGFEIWLPK